jgi:aryl-alcohol dehydrogenase-like predicted oxidoreductase
MTMPRRRIGRSGPEVSVLTLGSWHTWDRADFHDAAEIVRRAVDAGITFFDVGVYGGVPLEPGGAIHYSFTDVIFGRLLEQAGIAREQYAISAKLWMEYWPQHTMGRQLGRALERLRTGHAEFAVLGDLRDPDTDLPRLVEDLAEVVRSGALGSWGVNNWPVDTVRQVWEFAERESMPGPQLVQWQYSVCRRAGAESAAFTALVADTGISLEPSNIFEGGLLAGNPRPARPDHDGDGLRAAIGATAPELARLARSFGATPTQLAIAFCLTHPATATVLFGVSRMSQLEENLGALALFEREGARLRQAADGLWRDRPAGGATGDGTGAVKS